MEVQSYAPHRAQSRAANVESTTDQNRADGTGWMKLGTIIGDTLSAVARALGVVWRWIVDALANARRWVFRNRLPDFVVIALDHSISERVPTVPWWYAYIPGLRLPLSLEYISEALRRVAEDPDVEGAVFLMKAPGLSMAQAQSLNDIFERFRQWDAESRSSGEVPKRTLLVHLEQVDIPSYIVACGADAVTMTPMASWDVLGLRASPIFLKHTLARLGIEFDVAQIAPWKTAADQVSRSEMSKEGREQINWLLDGLSNEIIDTIASSRNLEADVVRRLIDRAPLTAQEAESAGLIDKAVYKDEIGGFLHTTENPASLKTYASIRGLVKRKSRLRTSMDVGLLCLKGTITGGESRTYPLPIPILGEGTIGSITVEQQIRSVRRDKNTAAVVVYIDSGGGSAMASDLIHRELDLLRREKPVIVYMGDVAASGGYYISAPATKIVAQGATLTGSIGVIVAKPVTAETMHKIGATRETIQRGRNAGLYSEESSWTPKQRELVEANVRHYYSAFKQRVAAGRCLNVEELDAICNGRVWTGRQALDRGLVDEIGDFQRAVDLACEAAEMPTDGTVRVRNISAPRNRILPEPASPVEAFGDGAGWSQLREVATALVQGNWQNVLGNEHYWYLADGLPHFNEIKRR